DARRPADANRPTPCGKSTVCVAAMTSAQAGPLAAITQACVVVQPVQPVALVRQVSESFPQTVPAAHRPAHEIASESTFSTPQSDADDGFAVLPRAKRI